MPDKKRKGRAKQELNREWECESTAVHMALKMRILNLQKTKEDELPPRTTEVDSVPQCGYILPGRIVKQTTFICWYVFIICFKRVQTGQEKLHAFLETLKLRVSHLQHLPHCNLKVPLLLHMGRSQNIYFSATLSFETSVFRLSTFFLHHLSCSCTLLLPFLPPAPRPAASPL